MKTKLSPFVHKVKGKRNYFLFDSLKKEYYNMTPEGNPQELEAQLLENELVIQTNGVIPFKYKPNIQNYKTSLILKELQLRIGGTCQFHCPDCGKIGKGIKNEHTISKAEIDTLSGQIGNMIIESLVFMGGNPLTQLDRVEYVKSKIRASSYKMLLHCNEVIPSDNEKETLDKMGIAVVESICHTGVIDEQDFSTDPIHFFFTQELNACWGNKLAIESDGTIKPCMWSDIILGNINEISVRHLILSGKCDLYWEMTKDKVETCKDCEYRYVCPDCRVAAMKESGNLYGRTSGCSYCVDSGVWE
ncbi:MAG: SPASM domain-containing protein [Candidatus Omnitrophota bacterium]